MKSVLIVYNEIPYPLTHGGNIRVYYLLKELSRNYNITLLTLRNKPGYCNVVFAPCFLNEFFRKKWFIIYLIKATYLKFERLTLPFKSKLLKKHNYQTLLFFAAILM